MSKYTHLGGTFWKSDSGVFCAWRSLKLDPKRVKVHFGAWATDGNRVFWQSFQRRKIDASSFVALNGWYAKDATAGYCGLTTTIKDADVDTLEVLDSGTEKLMFGLGTNLDGGYARDRSRVYFDGFHVKHADPASFASLGNCYGRDANAVIHTRFRLNGAVPLRWRWLGGGYSRDDQRVFYENRPVKNARIDHFRQMKPFDAEFAYDGSALFYRGEPTTVDYYVECLRGRVKCDGRFADLVESGDWQRNDHEAEWPYRAPDEVLQAYKTIALGYSTAEVLKLLGPGEVVAREHWDFFFPPLDKLIRPGFVEAGGTAPWSGDNSRTPAGCQVWRWNHPEQVLACSFLEDKVVAKIILDSDHATPPPSA